MWRKQAVNLFQLSHPNSVFSIVSRGWENATETAPLQANLLYVYACLCLWSSAHSGDRQEICSSPPLARPPSILCTLLFDVR